MDGDESFALIASCALAAVAAVYWYLPLLTVTSYASRRRVRLMLAFTPLVCLALVQGVLACCAAHEVKEGPEYDFLFLAGGAAWLGAVMFAMPLLGLCPREDVIESRNPAAVIAVCGAWAGATLCYAGANVGEGATIWTTFIPAAVATAAWFLLWFFFEIATTTSESITLDRDVAAALRLFGVLFAIGLVLGRAVAGDFQTWDMTWEDLLAQGWPALPIWVAAVIVQQALRPTPQRPNRPTGRAGLLPAAMYVLLALIDLLVLGPPFHRPGGR